MKPKIGAGLVAGVLNAPAPGKFIAKLGWKAFKFVGKKIWKGIKLIAMGVLALFASVFKVAGKFVNKVSNWIVRFASFLKDKTYKFILQPMASIMVTVFGFVTGIVMSPIKFIQWVVPGILNRVLGVFGAIFQYSTKVMKSTWSVFKKILFNPITIAVLIGGIFYLFGPKLLGWLGGMVGGIKETVLPIITSIASKIGSFLMGLGRVLFTVGKFLFKIIDWITGPSGPVARLLTFLVKSFFSVKQWIKKMMGAAGKDSIDAMCMFLAGDYIGIVIHAIAGMIVKFWKWLRNTRFLKIVFGIVKGVVGMIKLIGSMHITLLKSLGGALWELVKGNFSGVVTAFVKPYKDWWKQMKGVFATFSDAFKDPSPENEYMTEDPSEKAEEIASNARIAVRSLKMKGKPDAGIKYAAAVLRSNKTTVNGLTIEGLITKLNTMSDLLDVNVKQGLQYDDMIEKLWEMGKGNDDMSQQVMKAMLESPSMSQKLLSAFFYYDIQSGKTMMTRPSAYIGQFLDNIRNAVNDPDRDNQKVFKTLIEAFEQTNKERQHIMNKQGEALEELAKGIAEFNPEKAS